MARFKKNFTNEFNSLSEEAIKRLDEKNQLLVKEIGAQFELSQTGAGLIEVTVTCVNDRKPGKYELFDHVYRVVQNELPDAIRLIVKV